MTAGQGPRPGGSRPPAERLNTRAAGIIGLAVMCSRVLGLIREQVCAALFGGGGAMDAFTAAFRIPNLLRDLFAEGALSTAFVTTFSKTAARRDDAAAWALANKVATLAAVVLGALCVLGIVFTPQLVATLAPGFMPAKAALTVTLTRIMFPFILLVSLAALVMGMLNAKNVFGMPAMASSFFNVGSIVGGVVLGYWLDPHFGPLALVGLAIGTLFGGALQLGVQLPQLHRLGFRYRPDFRWRDPGVSAVVGLMGPSVIAASTTQFNVLINSIFASQLGDGPIFWLSIAFRLMQLPLGLFGVALGTVTLPLLSRLALSGELGAFRGELSRGMRLAFLLTIPCTVGLMMLAEPIVSVLYEHGRFDARQSFEAAGALRYYAIGLAGY
ncbi:MAG: murein biosynthesis integral membrane protein MurJ, partial [Gammaproteobacteria bacterium]|nr:murein biosynthesis integral membrane protein MurJ [Gammaproteobacteria bacterium]